MAVHFSQALSSTFWVNTAVDRMMKVLSQDSWMLLFHKSPPGKSFFCFVATVKVNHLELIT